MEHLGFVNKMAAIACRRYGIQGDDAEDAVAGVRMQLIEDDYAVLRAFRGGSAVKTYLASVISRLCFSYARQIRGRWRPSAAAGRLGPPAEELERLVRLDGYTVREAGELLRTAGRTTLSDADLARLLGQLPERSPLRPEVREPATGADAASGTLDADERVHSAESEVGRARVIDVLDRALRELEPEDQVIVRLHFGEGLTVSQIAGLLHLDQKPLYRRVDRLRSRLRAMLEDAGLSREDVQELLFSPDVL